jgi:hypothetical protein
MEKVCVLMSTYNGEKYLKEQIDSILNQENIKVDILVRDDGSTDNTLNILEQYTQKYENIRYYTGKNLKSAKSFMNLLFTVKEYDYYAFSDQDDVWKKNKLCIAVSKLKEGYDLYGGKKNIVDSKLNTLKVEDEIPVSLELGSVILRCRIAGCTMVFTKKLREELLKYNPEILSMHDSWVLKVAVSVGKVFFDSNKYILYRQHSNNVVGAKKSFINQLKERILNLKKRNEQAFVRLSMAKELYNNYANFLSKNDKENLYYFINHKENFKYRIKILKNTFIQGDNLLDTCLIKILILFGLF